MNDKRQGKGKPLSRGKNSRLPFAVNVTRNLSNDWFLGCESSNYAKINQRRDVTGGFPKKNLGQFGS